jgi:hypothetical protein
MLILGTIGYKEKHAMRPQTIGKRIEKLLGLSVDPMEVLDQEQQGLLPCRVQKEAP